MEFADNQLLRREILFEVVRQEVERRGLDGRRPRCPHAGRGAGRQLHASHQSAAAPRRLGRLPAVVPGPGRRGHRRRDLTLPEPCGGGPLDDADAAEAVYDENPAASAGCASATSWWPPRRRPQQVMAELDAGADFADGGRGQRAPTAAPSTAACSTPTASRARRRSSFVGDFVDGAVGVPTGQSAGPVQTEFGWHIIVVDKSRPVPFDECQGGRAQYATPEGERRRSREVARPRRPRATSRVDPKLRHVGPGAATSRAGAELDDLDAAPATTAAG